MEKALLVGLKTFDNRQHYESSLKELKNLTRTAGAKPVSTITQERRKPDPATFIGKGKAQEIKLAAKEKDIDLLIIDHEISPTQQRNLEKITDLKIIDKTALIIDIFSKHAHSKEGKIQVELAQYNYVLPRLTRMWTHLSRLEGGIGTRGPGETQLEIDRRRIQEKISRLKKQLKKIEKARNTQRKNRQRSGIKRVSLVGYTNSGKSTLLNALSGSDVLVENQLFSTLDPTTRKVKIRKNNIVVTDTVGFIDNLPHELVKAFKSTLEEVVMADLLVKVVDCSDDDFEEKLKIVDDTLEEIGANNKYLIALNKIDLLDKNILDGLRNLHPKAVFISAINNKGINELKKSCLKTSKHPNYFT